MATGTSKAPLVAQDVAEHNACHSSEFYSVPDKPAKCAKVTRSGAWPMARCDTWRMIHAGMEHTVFRICGVPIRMLPN